MRKHVFSFSFATLILTFARPSLLLLVDEGDATTEGRGDRDGKLLNVFTVVRFKNDPCSGTGTKNGTCYTAAECTSKGGTNEGSCASGFGICCTFSVSCGASSSENCTYFESSGSENSGACTISICPCSSGICQLRMDFSSFVITGPATTTTSVGTQLFGALTGATTGKKVAAATRCLTDTFSVTGGTGSNSPPVICGTNTGEHMYVDSSDQCNDLSFNLGGTASGVTELATRKWSIKITQYSCDYNNLAPAGCTQYFWGETTGDFMSYNYNSGSGTHLANQDHQFCFRKERNYCRICYSAASATDVQVSGKAGIAAQNTGNVMGCCGYGSKGTKTSGFDCIVIPGASKTGGSEVIATKQCGRSKGIVTAQGGASATVCTKTQPFRLSFLTDNWEMANAGDTTDEAVTPGKGLSLNYILSNSNC